MKNILITIKSLELGGGAERIAAELGSHLQEKRHNVTFLTYKNVDKTYNYKGDHICLDEDFDADSFPLQFTFRNLKMAHSVSEICKERNIDTVISFMMISNIRAILSKIIFGYEAKIIASVRSNPLMSEEKLNLQRKWLYPKADKVVALSKGVEQILRKDFSLENTTYIHNIQNLERFAKLADEEIRKEHIEIFDDNFIFITIGSLRKAKGQWYLLRCFKKVVEYNSNSKLVILGDGPLKDKLTDFAEKLEIDDKVFFLGNVENVFPYLRKSDCFVFTSLWEGFGNVLTEALSQDLPVISTDCISGPREILCPELEIDEKIEYPHYGEYGILVQPFEDRMFFKNLEKQLMWESEKIFFKIMVELMDKERLRRRYSKGYERVKDFRVDKIMKEWEKVI